MEYFELVMCALIFWVVIGFIFLWYVKNHSLDDDFKDDFDDTTTWD